MARGCHVSSQASWLPSEAKVMADEGNRVGTRGQCVPARASGVSRQARHVSLSALRGKEGGSKVAAEGSGVFVGAFSLSREG